MANAYNYDEYKRRLVIHVQQAEKEVVKSGGKIVIQDSGMITGRGPRFSTPRRGVLNGFAAGSGTATKHDSTYTGNVGSSAYTVGDPRRGR